MKKVNSIGKKLMAVGLSASLLMGSVGVKSCFAAETTTNVTQKNSTQAARTKKVSEEFTINGIAKKVTPSNKVSEKNKKSDFKENMKKAWDVCKWLMVSGFLAYAGYKNSKDIVAFCKDFCNFLAENKETFKTILDGGFTVLKGVSNAVLQVAKFVSEHPEATKNTMAAVGTYHVSKGLYDKVKKWFSKDKSNSKKETTYKITAKISK